MLEKNAWQNISTEEVDRYLLKWGNWHCVVLKRYGEKEFSAYIEKPGLGFAWLNETFPSLEEAKEEVIRRARHEALGGR